MLILTILGDAPFGVNVKVSNWDISTGKDQTEVTMAKSSNWVVSSWINQDVSGYYTVNQLAVSSDNGYTWTQVGYFAPSDPASCWVGDPSLAADPGDPNKFYWVGMVWCQVGSQTKGEVYFCSNTGSPDNISNWSCSILPPNDSWAHFKDKPWILARDNGGTTELLVVFTADGYGSTSLSTYEMISVKSTDGGATWQTPVRVDPGYASTVAFTYYDAANNLVHMADNCLYCYSSHDVVIEYTKSPDFGSTWNYVAGVLGTVPTGGAATCPNFNRPVKIAGTVAGVGNKVAMAAVVDESGTGGNSCSITIAYSTDGGSTWAGVSDTTAQYILPFVTTDGSNSIYVMAQSRTGSSAPWTTVMYSSNDWGSTWGGVRVSDHDYTMNENPAGHDYNTILYHSGDLFAIWGDDYYNEDAGAIYFATTAVATGYAELPTFKEKKVKVYKGAVDLPAGSDVYTSSGRLLLRSAEGKVSLSPGVYFVRNGSRVWKVVVR